MLVAVVVPAKAVLVDADDESYDYEVSAPSKDSPGVQIADYVKSGTFTVKYSNKEIFTGSGNYNITNIALTQGQNAAEGLTSVTVSETKDYAVLTIDSTNLTPGKSYLASFSVNSIYSPKVTFIVQSGFWADVVDFSASAVQSADLDVSGAKTARIQLKGIPSDMLESLEVSSTTVTGMTVEMVSNAQYLNGGFAAIGLKGIDSGIAVNGTHDIVLVSGNTTYTVKLNVTGGQNPAPSYDYEVSAPSKDSPNVQIADDVKVGSFTVKYSNTGIFTSSGDYSFTNVKLSKQNTAVSAPFEVTVPEGKDYAVLTIDSTSLGKGSLYTASFTVSGTDVKVFFTVGSGYWDAVADFGGADTASVSVDVTGMTGKGSMYVQAKGLSSDVARALTLDSVEIPGMTVELYSAVHYANGGFTEIDLLDINASAAVNGTYDLVMKSGNTAYTVKLTVTGGKDPAPAVSYDYEVSAPSKDSPNVQIADDVKVGSFTVKYSNTGIFTSSGDYSFTNVKLSKQNTAVSAPFEVTVPEGKDYAVLTIDSTSLGKGSLYTASFTVSGTDVKVFFTVGSGYWDAVADFGGADTASVSVDVTGMTGKGSMYVQAKGLSSDVARALTLDSVEIPGMTVELYSAVHYANGGFTEIDLLDINASAAVNGTYDLVMKSGNTAYTVKLTVTGGKDPAPAVSYDYEVSAPSKDSPNVMIPSELSCGSLSGVTIKYSNNDIDPTSTIESTDVLVNGTSYAVYSLTAVHAGGTKYVEMTLSGMNMLNTPSMLELKITFSTSNGLKGYSVFIATKSMNSGSYWMSIIDSNSTVEPTIDCYKANEYDGVFEIALTGITSVSEISPSIPGLSLIAQSDSAAYNGGFVRLSGTIDWDLVAYGNHSITITSEGKQVIVHLNVVKTTRINSDTYDYEFVGVSANDPGSADWYLDSDNPLVFKVQMPYMTKEIKWSAYDADKNTSLSSNITIDITENSIEGKYVIFKLSNKSLESPMRLRIDLSSGTDGIVGRLIVNVSDSAPVQPTDEGYVLKYNVTQVDANTRLNLNITKTDSAPVLTDAKLLVIVKYQGGVVINVYSNPQLVNGCGEDVIEVSSLNLTEVFVEVVDGFQHGSPVFYGYCVYQVGGE